MNRGAGMSSAASLVGNATNVIMRPMRYDDSPSAQMVVPRKTEVVSKQATKVTALSTKLEWKIDQFEKLMKLFKNSQNLISRQFGCPQAPTVTWELHVYPNGKREEDAGNVSFFLRQVGLSRGEDPIMTEFQIYALDAGGGRVSVCRDTKDFTNQQGRGKFQVSREKMTNALRADGSLLLICEVEYFPPGSKISVEQAEEDDTAPDDPDERVEMSIRDSLKEMLDQELFTDCTIKVQNKTLKAHRCILGQHSAVFRSMFNNEMIEARDGIIDITDAPINAIRAMIEFMYTGSTEMAENCPEDVLAIADKYAVLPLKEQCERFIANTITTKNITSVAIFADTYSAPLLKAACIRFLVLHHKTVIRSPEWKQLKKERGELANELLESVLSSQSSDGDEECGSPGPSSSASASSSASHAHHHSRNDTRSPVRKRMRRNAPGGKP